jgi:hypothetical protein
LNKVGSKTFSEDFSKSYKSSGKRSKIRTNRENNVKVNKHQEKSNVNSSKIINDKSTIRTTPHLRPDLGSGEQFDDFTESNKHIPEFDTFANQENRMNAHRPNLNSKSRTNRIKPTNNTQESRRQRVTTSNSGNNPFKPDIVSEESNLYETQNQREKNPRMKMIPDENESDNDTESFIHHSRFKNYENFLKEQRSKNQHESNYSNDYESKEDFQNNELVSNVIRRGKNMKNIVYNADRQDQSELPEEDIQGNYDVGRTKIQTNMTYSNKIINSEASSGYNQRTGRMKRETDSVYDSKTSEDRQIYYRKNRFNKNKKNDPTNGSDSNMRFY